MTIEIGENMKEAIIALSICVGILGYFWLVLRD